MRGPIMVVVLSLLSACSSESVLAPNGMDTGTQRLGAGPGDGSATGGYSGSYYKPSSLESALFTQLQANARGVEYPAGKQTAINSCVAKSVVDAIPADDQAQMLQAINTKQADDATDALFVKWMGRSLAAGPSGANDENTVLRSGADGVQYLDSKGDVTGSPTVTARIQGSALRICPDLYAHYPTFFQ